MSEREETVIGQIISAIKSADKDVLKRWIVPMVKDKILLNGEYNFCFPREPVREMTAEEAKEKGYINIEVPFSGLYQSTWGVAVEEELSQEFIDYLSIDKYERDASESRKEVWDTLEKTEIFKKQVQVDKDNLGDWISGKKYISIWVPMVMESIFEANLYGIKEILEYTYLSDIFAELDWKLDECWSPNDYNYATDHLYYWVKKDIWKKVCIPEVFNNRWYKRYAKVMTTPVDGYVPGEKYQDYFDTENPCCNKAVLKFWIAVGNYARYYDNVVHPSNFEKIKDKDYFNEEDGIVNQLDSIESLAADIWNRDYKLEDAH